MATRSLQTPAQGTNQRTKNTMPVATMPNKVHSISLRFIVCSYLVRWPGGVSGRHDACHFIIHLGK